MKSSNDKICKKGLSENSFFVKSSADRISQESNKLGENLSEKNQSEKHFSEKNSCEMSSGETNKHGENLSEKSLSERHLNGKSSCDNSFCESRLSDETLCESGICEKSECSEKATEDSHSSHHSKKEASARHHKAEASSEGKILLAFILNFGFSIFEFIGGHLSGSVAIASDAVHDFGDALSIGVSWLLERKSKREPDRTYTYGYGRFSVLGALITNLVLLLGSVTVIVSAVKRLINPTPIDYNAMIIFAVCGLAVNFLAALITSKGEGLNQKSINLHMMEDVLGWAVVLAGAVVMRFTDLWFIDSLMSLGVSVFLLWHVMKNLREIGNLFLIRIPEGISVSGVEEALLQVSGVVSVHHVHIWSVDSESNFITLHIVTDDENPHLKEQVRSALGELNITHVTMELESLGEECPDPKCHGTHQGSHHHHHHHHGHSH